MPVYDIEIRHRAARDSFEAMTRLLHRAYAPLAAAGMNFTAATQTPEMTAKRVAEGQCFVAEQDGQLVGTVTVCGPYGEGEGSWSGDQPWFRDRDTAHFHQFAVHPDHQGRGLGSRLVAACEDWARQRGYRRLALDTAEPATALRAMYARLGFQLVGHTQWAGKHYRSVILLKALDRSPLREQLELLARYNAWATRRLLAAVAALPDADYRRPLGLAFGSVHGTLNHLLVAEHALWRPRFAEGLSPTLALDTELESDRQRLAQRLQDGADAWAPLLAQWSEARLVGRLDYRKRDGTPVSFPFAATLLHMFNHGTHHRGQVSAALTQLGQPAPELDLMHLLAAESSGPAVPLGAVV